MNPLDQLFTQLPEMPEALCAKSGNPDFWFPEFYKNKALKSQLEVIKRICGECVHRIECADFAIKEDISDGVWGGLTPRERTALRGKVQRKRRISNAGERIAAMKENGMTYRQIADVMDMSPNAAQAALLRHRKRTESVA